MKKVLLLLANGFEMHEASVFIDVIGWNSSDGDKSTQLFTCGLTKEVKSSFGQKLIVDYLVHEIHTDAFDACARPGGFEEFHYYEDAFSEPFLNVIREFNASGKTIASICTASLALGKSGVLTGRNGTTYNLGGIRQKQ
ncbi:MAG: DJ-1/PfpI family protein, partial [Spirochaetota bacterium]